MRRIKKKYILLLFCFSIILLWIYNLYFIFNDENNQEVNINNLKYQQIIPWSVKSLNATQIWTRSTGKSIRVAVMDSGINFNHAEFGDNVKKGYNAINPNESPIDDFGHGTLVAGVIVAKNNNIGIVGIAPDVELYPVKVLDKYGEGDIKAIEDGINWCIDNKIQIINMSFAILNDKTELKTAIDKAINSGIIIVASASNTYGGLVGYPASYNKVFSVTSIDKNFVIGRTSPIGKIDFSAPGVDIISTSNDGGYEIASGTSMATPYITGEIALILQNPSSFELKDKEYYNYEDIYNALKKMAKDLGEKGKDDIYGEGIVILN